MKAAEAAEAAEATEAAEAQNSKFKIKSKIQNQNPNSK